MNFFLFHHCREFSSSPDDLDSNESPSPDLKTSEAEFIESLETRVFELVAAKKKESETIQRLETQLRLLTQVSTGITLFMSSCGICSFVMLLKTCFFVHSHSPSCKVTLLDNMRMRHGFQFDIGYNSIEHLK